MTRTKKKIRSQVSKLEVELTEAPSSFIEASVEEVEKPTESLSSALTAAFKEDNKVRVVLSEHLAARARYAA